MNHLISELIPVDRIEALPRTLHVQLGQALFRSTPPIGTERTEARELLHAVEWELTRAMALADIPVNLNETLGLAIISAEDDSSYALHPEEARILSPRACLRKRIEFTAGRAAAHFALEQIGLRGSFPILRGANGEPLWPEGIASSITHCFPWNVAAAVRCPHRVAFGLDLETAGRLGPIDVSEFVCTNAELQWVRAGNPQERLIMIFSSKEAVYKAFYPFCHRYIDFKDVELTWVSEKAFFQGRFLTPLGPNLLQGHSFAVHCRPHAELVFSCVIHRPQRQQQMH